MWGLLKRLSSDCWGQHDWIAKANAHGLWLECRHCGQESAGVELPPVRYHRTQEGAEDAHRLGGVPPARRNARVKAVPVPALRFSDKRSVGSASIAAAAKPWDATPSASMVATTDGERRWLQAFRAMSIDQRRAAEQMVSDLQRDHRVAHDRLVG